MTSRREFRAVYDRGRRARGRWVTVFALANDLGHGRVGFTVTRKAGGAVRRNRIKRLLREIYRRNRLSRTGSFDFVINAHPSIRDRSYAEVEGDVVDCVRRLGGGATS